MKIIKKIIPLLILGYLIFRVVSYYQDDLVLAWHNLNKRINPCGEPLAYSFGTLDERFSLSQEQLMLATKEAELVWETPLGRDLFAFADDSTLKINLLYDTRQDSTLKLKKLGLEINTDTATYESLKNKYASLTKNYDSEKNKLAALTTNYKQQKNTYDQAIKSASQRNGVNPEEYAQLESERSTLNDLVATIEQAQNKTNKLVEDINAVANVVNRLVRELNLNVDNYNTVGEVSSGEFQAGEYVSDATGERINLYQFDNNEELVALLAHELGHALGLEHLDNSDALMYRLEQNGNATASAPDLAAMKSLCRIK